MRIRERMNDHNHDNDHELTMIMNNKLMGMQCPGFQGQAKGIRDMVQLLSMSRQLMLDAKASPFVAQAATLILNFASVLMAIAISPENLVLI